MKQLSKKEIEIKILEELSEVQTRILQTWQGRDKNSEVLLELGDVEAWISVYKNHPDVDRGLVDKFKKKKLKSIKSKYS